MAYPLNLTRVSGHIYPFVRDDNKTLTFQCKVAGVAKNIAGATFAFEIYDRQGGQLLRSLPANILDASAGTWRVQWSPDDGAALLPVTSITSKTFRYRARRTLSGVATTLLTGELEVLGRPPDNDVPGYGALGSMPAANGETLDVTVDGEVLVVEIGTVAAPGGDGGGVTDHGALSGLADDDHPQYLNSTRHSAITGNPHGTTAAQVGADPAGTASSAVAAHVVASDPHGDRAFATAAVGTHAAAAGAHPIAGVDGLAAALALLAPLLSPALTGTPTAPTATAGTSSTQIANTAFVANAIAALLNSAPGALDTLDELAAALGDDPNFATTITNALAGKLAKASNLADLTNVSAALTNLGATTIGAQVFAAANAAAIRTLLVLGGAATLNVGTAAGTVAAGDDSRITGAVQGSRSIATQHSLAGGGDLTSNRTLALVGDTAAPGNTKYYGTDASGVRGWFDLPSGGGAVPAGVTTELQYRAGATTLGAVPGSHVDAANGRLSLGAGSSPAGVAHLQADNATERVLVLQMASSPTANPFEVRNSGSTVLVCATSDGVLSARGLWIQAGDELSLRGNPASMGRYGIKYDSATDSTALYGYASRQLTLGFNTFGGTYTALMTLSDSDDTFASAAGVTWVLRETSGASAAPADAVRLYAEDSGGKTRLMARFPTGAAQQLAIEP